ncbi:MAG TPA: hypothetical protein VNZ01_03220 [Solirubrobacteraceae bacterium]|jgi:hypothetical protein|nr:hypothetical protein [Solirubrobacteraceae bacterium]
MKKTLLTSLAALCVSAALAAPTASASSEYFYNGYLGNGGAVSGVPHGSTYFVGAYTGSTNNRYCIFLQNANGVLWYEKCVSFSTSNTESFPSQFGRGYLFNSGGGTAHFIAEERW